MATHSSILAWRIPGMEEPGGLPSMGLHRVGHHPWAPHLIHIPSLGPAPCVGLHGGIQTFSDGLWEI